MTTQTVTHHADDETLLADKPGRFEHAARLMVRAEKLLVVSGLMGLLVAAFLASPSPARPTLRVLARRWPGRAL